MTQKTAMVVASTPRMITECKKLKQAADRILTSGTDSETSVGNIYSAREKDKRPDKQLHARRDKQANTRPDSRSSDSSSRFYQKDELRPDPYAGKPSHLRY